MPIFSTEPGGPLLQPGVSKPEVLAGRFSTLVVCLCLAGIAILQLVTLKPGQRWDGDAELYIMNGLNILHHAPYAKTGYVVNWAYPIHPASYPPGLPLLLVPILALWGINYVAMKAMLIVFFMAALAIMARVSMRAVGVSWTILFLAALGLNPYLWSFKNTVFSEFPFLAFAYCALFCFDCVDQGVAWRDRKSALVAVAAGIGLCLGSAYTVRPVAFILFAAILAATLLRYRALWWFGALSAITGAAIAKLITYLYPPDVGTYQGYVASGHSAGALEGVPHRMHIYLRTLGSLLVGAQTDDWGVRQKALALFFLILCAIGLVDRIRQRVTVFELFFILYVSVIVAFPAADEPNRYALPLLPLTLFYVTVAVSKRAAQPGRARVLALCLAMALALLYVPQYRAYAAQPSAQSSVDSPDARELYMQVQSRVPPGDLVLCLKPTVIALYTQRQATNPARDPSSPEFAHSIQSTTAGWFVDFRQPVVHPGSLAAAVGRERRLDLQFENPLFALYRITPDN